MQKAFLVAALLALGLLAGCTGKTTSHSTTAGSAAFDASVLSQPIYKAKPAQEVWVTASDGVRLNNALFLPDVPAGIKVPVFINFSPYHGDGAMTGGDNFAQYMVHHYVPRGYAVVLSALRGTGHSEGCFQIGGDQELKDTRDVIDFFGTQPWSNGNVAAGGKSYDSTTQNGVIAKFPTPHLKGIFHDDGITAMYDYNGKDGVTYANGLAFNSNYGAGQGLDEYGIPGVGTHQNTTYGGEDAASLTRASGDIACPELPKENASGVGTAASGLKDAYWQERDWVQFLPKSTWNGTVFFVHGLEDWNVKPDDIDPWVDILQAKHIKVLGWLHQETENEGHLYPERQDWNDTMLRWMDATLKGIDTHMDQLWGFEVQGSDPTGNDAVSNADRALMPWRRSATWPPTGSNHEQPATEAKPVATATRVSGVPYVRVGFTSPSPDPVLHATLYDVQGSTRTWVSEAARRAALSDDLTQESGWMPGSSKTFNLTFYPIDHTLEAGHSLQVVFDYTGGNAGFTITPDQEQGATYDGAKAVLGYHVADPGGELSPQPFHMKCFTC